MALGIQTERILDGIYSARRTSLRAPININNDLNFTNNNVFKLFLNVNVGEGEVEIPLTAREDVILYLDGIFFNGDAKKLIINLYENGYSIFKRTANSIFKHFESTSTGDRLSKVVTNKGEIYYGTHGLILDKDFTPLLLYTLVGDIKDDKITYNKARIYVHPKVFLSNGIVEKGIIKVIIPRFAEKGVHIDVNRSSHECDNITIRTTDAHGRISRSYPIAEIVVADITNKFFSKPERPKIDTFTKESVGDFLLEHLDDITKGVNV